MINQGERGRKYIKMQRKWIATGMICMRGMMGNSKGQVNRYASMNLTLVKDLGLFYTVIHFIAVLDL